MNAYRSKTLREQIGDNKNIVASVIRNAELADDLTDEQEAYCEKLFAENQKLQAELDLLEQKEEEMKVTLASSGFQAASLAELQDRFRQDQHYAGDEVPGEDVLRSLYNDDSDQEKQDFRKMVGTLQEQGKLPGKLPQSKATQWRDQNGNPVHMLAKGQNWSDLPGGRKGTIEAGLGIGDFVKGVLVNDKSKVSPGIRAALSEGQNQTGGVLVPDELMRRLVDKARAASVIMRAGAQTVPMTTETLRLARVSGDPTVETKIENEAFSGSDISFDSITFTTHTLGILLKASRELAEDAPNFASQVEQVLTAAFAAKLDNIAVNGISTGIAGMLDWESGTGKIGETGSIGAIAWEDLHAAVVALQLLNYQPNAYVINPDISGDLATLTTGDGTNSAKGWLPPPSTVAPLASLPTTNIANDSIIVGDFTQLVWGIRHGAMIETTTVAGDSFAQHQVWVKLVWRGDLNALRRDAFHRLVGITT